MAIDFKKITRNGIAGFILIGLVGSSFSMFIPERANAQAGIGGALSLSGGIASGAATALLSCSGITNKLNDGLTDLFEKKGDKLLEGATGKIGEKIGASLGVVTGTSVPISVAQDSSETKDIQNKTEKLEKKESCLDRIAIQTARILILQLTRDIVNWINTGNAGAPLYVTDPQAYFRSIKEKELQGFVNVIGYDDLKYPFGKLVAQNLVNSFTQEFEDVAEFSLNKVIEAQNEEIVDWRNFYSDFTIGGWAAWNAMTQFPQNNPYGFSLMAQAEYDRRVVGTDISLGQTLMEELKFNRGFLSQRRCVDPKGYIPQKGKADICKKYEIVTPGLIAAEAITDIFKNKQRDLDKVDEWSEIVDTSLSAIFDAALNRIVKEGFSTLTDFGDGAVTSTFAPGSNIPSTFTGGGVGSGWFSSFNISGPIDLVLLLRTQNQNDPGDVNLIKSTEEFIDQLEQIIALLSERNYLGKQGLIEAVESLDEAMPEPDLGWQDRLAAKIQADVQLPSKYWSAILTLEADSGLIADKKGKLRIALRGGDTIVIEEDLSIIQSGFVDYNELETAINALNFALAGEIIGEAALRELSRIKFDIANHNIVSADIARDEVEKTGGYLSLLGEYKAALVTAKSTLRKLEAIDSRLDNAGASEMEFLRRSFVNMVAEIPSDDSIAEVNDQYSNFLFTRDSVISLTAQVISELGDPLLIQGGTFANIPWGQTPRNEYSIYSGVNPPVDPFKITAILDSTNKNGASRYNFTAKSGDIVATPQNSLSNAFNAIYSGLSANIQHFFGVTNDELLYTNPYKYLYRNPTYD